MKHLRISIEGLPGTSKTIFARAIAQICQEYKVKYEILPMHPDYPELEAALNDFELIAALQTLSSQDLNVTIAQINLKENPGLGPIDH